MSVIRRESRRRAPRDRARRHRSLGGATGLHQRLRHLHQVVAGDAVAARHLLDGMTVVRLHRQQHHQPQGIIGVQRQAHRRTRALADLVANPGSVRRMRRLLSDPLALEARP